MKRAKKVMFGLGIVLILILVGIIGLQMYLNNMMSKVPEMTKEEVLDYMMEDKKKAIVTVGIIENDEMNYTVYGNNGAVLPQKEYDYEIGSISKTFTASLLAKGIEKGDFNLEDSIDRYIELEDQYYPSLKEFVSHTSGYKSYYVDFDLLKNSLSGVNALSGIHEDKLVQQLEKKSVKKKDYAFNYSNFGISVIGKVLSEKYGDTYSSLMNNFIKEDLHLENTHISDGTGNMENYWHWEKDDAYLPAGGILSTITDMMKYTKLHMEGETSYLNKTREKLTHVSGFSKQLELMEINIDGAGMTWMLDEKNNLVWHNGGTGNFNTYMAFDPDRKIGVVVLSNLGPNERIPATVLGYKTIIDLQNK